jgi:hypothetical protein
MRILLKVLAVSSVAALCPAALRADGVGGMPPPPPPQWPGTPTVGPATGPMPSQSFKVDVVGMALRSALGSEWLDFNNPVGSAAGSSSLPRAAALPRKGNEPGWRFLPAVPPDLLLLASLTASGQHLQPWLTPDFMAAAYLVEIGEPSLVAVESARGLSPSVDRIVKYVREAVRPLPDSAPAFAPAADPVEAMQRRLVVEDLLAGYPHSTAFPFAPRILADRSLVLELLPRILEAARHRHPLLRRNAVQVLAGLVTEDAAEAELCRTLESTEDAVCRYRALHGLMARRSAKAGAILRAQIKAARDEYYRAYALYALGFIDPESGREAAVAALRERSKDDDDSAWAAVQVLARSAPAEDEGMALLRKLEEGLRVLEGPVERARESTPAVRTYRVRVVRRMVWCALAQSGAAEMDSRIVRALAPDARRRVLEDFPDTSTYLAIDVLARASRASLWKVIRDPKEAVDVRARAIDLLGKPEGEEPKELSALAFQADGAPLVRAAASVKLAAPGSTEAALGLLRLYSAGGLADEGDPSKERAALVAARFLSDRKALRRDELLAAFDRAARDREDRARRLEPEVAAKGKGGPARIPPHVPLVEALLSAMAQEGSVECLRRVVETLRGGRERLGGEAALALGESGPAGAEAELLEALASADGWTRFAAAWALARRIKGEVACDWIWGAAEARKAGEKRWREIVAGK